ncbi:MAG TPA: HD-GYP domain-containing protein [Treponema sp.]|nr:HD-GYP domain-containing protein [Treponema sp.]
MLKKVYRNELEEGMRFSAPVFFDDGKNMLVSKGAPIKARELYALDRWKINYVLTVGVPVSADELLNKKDDEFASLDEMEEIDEVEELDDIENASELVEGFSNAESSQMDSLNYTSEQILKLPEVLVNDELYRAYHELISSLDEVFDDIREKREIKTRGIDLIVNGLVTLVNNNRTDIVGFILGGDVQEMELAKSSVNVAILSIIISVHLGLPRHRVLQIATGALLHDIGMLKIPSSIISKESSLDETETQLMRSHTFYGYKMIVNELLYADEVGKAAVQHHERWDGDGYPGRLAGQNIDIGARIISVADAFEAMVSPKAYRNSMVGYKAMRNLLADNARRFDPDIIKAMIQSMGIYPVGSIVLMNNSSIARVIESHKEAPLRPVIRVLIDEFAKPYTLNEGELVNLMDNRTLFIARAIDPAEYQKRI